MKKMMDGFLGDLERLNHYQESLSIQECLGLKYEERVEKVETKEGKLGGMRENET